MTSRDTIATLKSGYPEPGTHWMPLLLYMSIVSLNLRTALSLSMPSTPSGIPWKEEIGA